MNLRVGDLLGCFDGDEVGLAVVGDEVGFYRDYKQAVRVYPFCDTSVCKLMLQRSILTFVGDVDGDELGGEVEGLDERVGLPVGLAVVGA